MAIRAGVPNAEPQTRQHLLEEYREFMHLMVSTLVEAGPESGRYAYGQLHPRLELMESGSAFEFSRMSLPSGHRLEAPHNGRPSDHLLITEHDVVFEI